MLCGWQYSYMAKAWYFFYISSVWKNCLEYYNLVLKTGNSNEMTTEIQPSTAILLMYCQFRSTFEEFFLTDALKYWEISNCTFSSNWQTVIGLPELVSKLLGIRMTPRVVNYLTWAKPSGIHTTRCTFQTSIPTIDNVNCVLCVRKQTLESGLNIGDIGCCLD